MEHHKSQQYQNNFFFAGLAQDIDPELISNDKGVLLDSTQFIVKDRLAGVVQKLYGDKRLVNHTYRSLDGDVCVGLTWIGGYIVEFWREGAETAIYLNGYRCAKHTDIPGDATHHLDIAVSAEVKEIYVTDNKRRPVVYNVEDLFSSRITTKYFADYDALLYEINTKVQLNQPYFLRLTDVGIGGGVKLGSYSYAMRYVTRVGDKTRWSPTTPVIPIPEGYSEENIDIVPGHKVYGAAPSLTASRWGVRLRLRVTNTQGFDFVELRRFTNDAGNPVGYTPRAEVLRLTSDSFGAALDIKNNPISVFEFTDLASHQWLALDEDEITELAPIKTARTIRVVDGRIVLGGVTYESRSLDDNDIFTNHSNSKLAFAIKQRLEPLGYSMMKNQVYNKSLRTGERYGFAVKLIDSQGNDLYAIPLEKGIQKFGNFKVPERRDAIPTDELAFSYKPTETSTIDSNKAAAVDKTYEIFDQGTTSKQSLLEEINIVEETGKDYNPLTPTGRGAGQNTNSYTGIQSRINIAVDGKAYTPDNFNPDVIATGLSIGGVDKTKLPSWVSGFSVVRTPAAGRVVCQGLGTYALDRQGGIGVPYKKFLDRLWFYSPELSSVIGDKSTLFDDIKANPQNYEIHLVSPLAFNSELYNAAYINPIGLVGQDLASYVNLLKPHGNSNPVDTSSQIGWANGHTAFGRWRNTGSVSANMSADIYNSSDFIFPLLQAKAPSITLGALRMGRSELLELVVDGDIYHTPSTASTDSNSAAARNFHEPFYIVNIVQVGNNVGDNDINTYQDVGHYQKLDSLIGVGSGEDGQEFLVVDERKEDFFPDYYAGINMALPINDRKIWVDGQPWLCSNFRTQVAIDAYIVDLEANGFFTVNSENYYGLYKVDMLQPFDLVEVGATKSKITLQLLASTPADPSLLFTLFLNGQYYDIVYSLDVLPDLSTLPLSDGEVIMVPTATDEQIVGGFVAAATGYTDMSTATDVIIQSKNDGAVYNINVINNSQIDGTPVIVDYSAGTLTEVSTDTINRRANKIYFPHTRSDSSFIVPDTEDEVRIKYDSRLPLKIFLGDNVIGESLCIALDGHTNLQTPSQGAQTFTVWPLPFYNYTRSSLYRMPLNPAGATKVEPRTSLNLLGVRQWAMLFMVESTVNIPFVHKNFFPYRHYTQRPAYFLEPKAAETVEDYLERHNIFVNYDNDYPDEYLTWGYGGFHFPEGSNFDYQKPVPLSSFSRPKSGVDEVLKYPTRIQWGLQRNPAFRFAGASKNFPPFNFYDLRNNNASQISILYSTYSDKGYNLYAITDRGVSLILTNQSILRGSDGELTAMIAEGSFINGEIILNAFVGCPNELWRGKAEGKVRTGSNVSVPILIFPGYNDLVLLQENSLVEFGTNYRKSLQPIIKNLDKLGAYTSTLCGGINEAENHLIMRLGDKEHRFGFGSTNNWMTHRNSNYTKLIFSPYISGSPDNNDRYVAAAEGLFRTTVIEAEDGLFQSSDNNPADDVCEIVFVNNPDNLSTNEFVDMFLSASHKPDYVHCSVFEDFSDHAVCINASVQEYSPDGHYYYKLPRTQGGRTLSGKRLFVKVGYNNSDHLYKIKYAKIGSRKVAGG